jgi:hypothetical protein
VYSTDDSSAEKNVFREKLDWDERLEASGAAKSGISDWS